MSAITCLMKEWPTRVRTGVPPCSRDHLGHGLRADQVVQHRAARALGEHADRRRSPWWSTRTAAPPTLVDEEHPVGVAVEGEADVGAGLEHPGLEVDAGSRAGSGRRGGRERAVELAVHDLELERAAPANTVGTTRPPMPLAVSATTFSGRRHRGVDERAHVVGEGAEQVAGARAGRRRRPPRRRRGPTAVGASMSSQAGVLTDRAGAGEAELDAVVLGRVVRGGEHRPGASSDPAAKYSRSVEARPRSTTSSPCEQTPSANAATISTPEGRMSRATSTRVAPGPPRSGRTRRRSPARSSASNCSGTTPRTS